MSLLQAVLIAFFAYCSWIASPWLGGQGVSYHVFGKPLVAGLIVGIIMGDVVNGVIIGATINALYIGTINPGGAMSSDLNIAGYVGTALALSTGVNAEMAVSIAVPLGLIGTFAWQLYGTINSFFVHRTDEYAAKGDLKKLTFMTLGLPQMVGFALRFIPVFLVLYFGSSVAQNIVDYIPTWLTDIITVIGGMLPALGMAVLLKMLLTKPSLMGYFIIGFIAVSALKLPIFTVALVGVALGMINFLNKSENGGAENA